MMKQIQEHNESVRPNDRILATLRREFPQCFTREGTFDLEKFSTLVRGQVDITREGYELNFLGKSYANLIANTETETFIVPDTEHNSRPENGDSQNIYISGDNIDALKHLLKSYTGSIKCIYIDPPYNTGSDGFVYNDRFTFTAEQLQIKLGVDEEKAKRILDLTKRGSASHSAWLMYMTARLTLAKDLLSDDGVMLISIDDNEQANLKLLCDEIFGEENLIIQLLWESKYTVSNDTEYVSGQHEYILFYARNKSIFKIGRLERSESQNSSYKNRDNDPKGPWKPTPLHAKSGTENSKYEIVFDNGIKWTCPPGRYPRYSKETLLKLYADGELYFNRNGGVDKKTYLEEVSKKGVVPGSILHYQDVGHTHGNNEELAELLGKGIFDNPKGTKLICRLCNLANLQPDSIVLDFFAGSATTAHAVMQLNAEDGGNRRFIMVQIQEQTPAGSEARKAGYDTIDQIGRERIRRAAAKIREAHPDRADTLDLGFKHYTLRDVPQNTLDKVQSFDPTAAYADADILHTFGVETVLATWLVQDGYGFGAKAEELPLAGYIAHLCGSHLYCISGANFNEEAMIALMDKYNSEPDFNPQHIVVFGYSFAFTQLEMLKKNMHTLIDSAKNLKINLDIRY